MALILSIDTAMENAGLCIADDAKIISLKTNSRQTDHAAWLHAAIKDALHESGKEMKELQAIAVTSGPGSYTGLRVGMASAKGLCYVLQIPLITENTLHLIAYHAKEHADEPSWICPMIDARRMEVFTTLYDDRLHEQMQPEAAILSEHSFLESLDAHRIIFCGNGSEKWERICHHPNAIFSTLNYTMNELAMIAHLKFINADFTELAWSEPAYLKNVYMSSRD